MEDTDNKIQIQLTPLLVDDVTIARLLSISRAHFLSLEKQGSVGPRPIECFGRRRLYRYSEFQRWVDAGLPRRIEWVETK